MRNNLLFQIKDGEIVPPYTSKVKRIRVLRNEILPLNATLRVQDSKLITMSINNGSCKGKSKFSVYGNRENGGMKVYNLAVEEIQEISKGNIPQQWIEKLNDRKMLEDKEMLETKKIEEAAVVEETVNGGKVEVLENVEETVVGEEVVETAVEEDTVETVAGENEKEKDSMEEVIKIIDSMSDSEEDVEIDMNEVDMSENDNMPPENEETTKLPVNADEYDEKNSKLAITHPINDKSRVVVLCFRDGYRLEMQISVKAESKLSGGCVIYLVNEKTGEIFIGNKGAMKIDREKILNADNYEVFNCLDKFDLTFKESDKKIAFERACEFIEISKSRVEEHNSMTISEAYKSLVDIVITKAKLEEKNREIIMENRNYKYDENAGIAQVRVCKFQEALDEADTGFKRREFCKGLRMEENSTGRKIIHSNKSGGYGFNDSNNITWFRFSTRYKEEVI